MLEATLAEWKKWYTKNRSEDWRFRSSLANEPDEDTVLTRLWNAQDGRSPDGATQFRSSVWKKSTKGKKTKSLVDDIAVLTAPGQPPLILSDPDGELVRELTRLHRTRDAKGGVAPNVLEQKRREKSDEKKDKKRVKNFRRLEKPYLWRCRDCGEEFIAGENEVHCSRRARQIASCSPDCDEWFEDYLGRISWKYIHFDDVDSDFDDIVDSEEAKSFASEAGESLESILNDIVIEKPSKFELYNEQTRYLRVSDLKDEVKFKRVIKNIPNWRKMRAKPLRNAPIGPVELGHAFDELLTSTFASIESDEWSAGEKVLFECGELGVTVTGTPDLLYKGIPVEMKTVRLFPHEGENEREVKAQKAIFKGKWKRNYAKQVAIYLQGLDNEWMLLLIISRQSGLFTVVPINDRAMERMRENWTKWGAKYQELLENYRNLLSEENSGRDEK